MKVSIEMDADDVFQIKDALQRVLDDLDLLPANRTYNVWSNKLGEENRRVAKVITWTN